jgi:Glycosyl hydrolase family 10
MKMLLLVFTCATNFLFAQNRWTPEQTNSWYATNPWLVGCNYIPNNAINELEMFQPETFDTARINLELGWAERIGMNTLRVFLHDLLWKQDSTGFSERLGIFLAICERHHIRPMLVLFDSVWDPHPRLGKQREPTPGVHNSGWVQSPGAEALENEKEYPRLENYVRGVVGKFHDDKRILCWDIWNEPDNTNGGNYSDPKDKVERIVNLLPKAFHWARMANPSQPLTSGVWKIDVANFKALTQVEMIQLEESDVISFHCYGDTLQFMRYLGLLKPYKRPIICTEYLARGFRSTFETILPMGKKEHVGMINWGCVVGKTQTNLPWDSWSKPYINGREPAVWHHELFYSDGRPYRASEIKLIQEMTGHAN